MNVTPSPTERVNMFDALLADLYESERARFQARRYDIAVTASLVAGAADRDAA